MTAGQANDPVSASVINQSATTAPTTAIVLKGYPRLSETFIAQEIAALERHGLKPIIVSLRRPTDREVHPIHKEITAAVNYLPEYLYQAPRRLFQAWRQVRQLVGYRDAVQQWRADFRRDMTPNRIRRFGQALILAAELPATVSRIHAHFLHTPASVARYASILKGLPWSVSAHAVDIWTSPEWELSEKLAACDWAVTCTAKNQEYLASLSPDPSKVTLAYHGLDVQRFAAPVAPYTERDGHDDADPVVILSVGRAVEKKGYDLLLSALARLPHELSWRFVHIGGGALQSKLADQAERLGIAPRIRWLGPQSHERVITHYRVADVFVLASRVAKNGDRDGLPNVLMEAQSQGLPCISTEISGIPELVTDNETGLLSPADDVETLVRNLQALITNPVRRRALGQAGNGNVRASFSFDRCLDPLLKKFDLAPDRPTSKVA